MFIPNSSKKECRLMLSARRLIVKIGSTLIADAETGEIHGPWLERLIEDVVRFLKRGQEVIIITSGAVTLGSCHFTRSDGLLGIGKKQAAAAIGQVRLMLAFEQSLKRNGFGMGQVLLAREDFDDQHRRGNLRSTLQQLLKVGAVPVLNENDTTAAVETCLGDNDRLAAQVAQLLGADLLILLSDVDGLFTEDPHRSSSARLVREVRRITPEIEGMAADSASGRGSGGMVTKLMAARIAMDAGCIMVIAKGKEPCPLTAIANGGTSTWFLPQVGSPADRPIGQWKRP
ncbi:glutamate 5-kinase [Sinorhizobium meliloti]|uniref:glutamate 5-kinase n=1 Tax=Rhizobium meliloti TaxID=382 RepID=UPI0018658A49|nr:glutamate 5-kinase [Sinorhizobium meliloti]